MIKRALAAALWGLLPFMAAASAQNAAPLDNNARIRALLSRLEEAVKSGASSAYFDLLAASANRSRAAEFCDYEVREPATKVVIQERDRQDLPGALPGDGYRLIVDAFIESGDRARIGTWQLDVKKSGDDWSIDDQDRVSGVDNLYRLSVNRTKQFAARNLTISAEDLDLTLEDGSVFTIDTDRGVTGLVLLGRGNMRFHPKPDSEKGQVRILSGSEMLETRFDTAYIRLGGLAAHLDRSQLVDRPVEMRDLRKAEQIFRNESFKSYALDLADLTPDTWSLMLTPDDFVAEIHTSRFETLTYARSSSEPEDITLFDRRRQRNIALYKSSDKLASQGRFYDESGSSTFDVTDYNVDVTFSPTRQWIEGVARLRLRVKSTAISQLTLHLADSLAVQSIAADRLGRLFYLRTRGQNSVLVNLPATLVPDTDFVMTVRYAGPLPPQPADREALALQEPDQGLPGGGLDDILMPKPEPNFLYSNRSFWYPQPGTANYATATLHVTVPADYECIATGEPGPSSPLVVAARDGLPAIKIFMFTAPRPLRYLAFVVSRFTQVSHSTLQLEDGGLPVADPPAAAKRRDSIDLTVQAGRQVLSRGNTTAADLVDIEQFYYSILGDVPYPTYTVAVLESMLPGGHSPAYFGLLDEPLPTAPNVWRNDPASFPGFPEFFLAHEVAHQWWGGAVGWRNYHEQWLSEGFAQYFAALYAQHRRGDAVFESLMRKMRKSALDQSDQGPIYLGYRVGHIRNDGRVFRSVIYNKAALSLHMLRRLIGDPAFFRGLRSFYEGARFRKVGTEDFRQAMEAVSESSLERFFERWIYQSSLPRVTFTYRVEPSAAGQDLIVHFEQTGDIFDLPVTLTLQYADRRPVDIVVRVTDRLVDQRVPLEGQLRGVEVSRNDGTLAEIKRF